MKLNLILASLFLSAGAGLAVAADQPGSSPATGTAASTPEAAADNDLQRVMGDLEKKITAGATTESELAPEIKQLEALIAAHRGNKADADFTAKALYVEANLYMKVLQDYEKAESLLQTIKSDFPRTRAYFAASGMLDRIDMDRESYRTQSALKPGKPFPDFNVTDANGAPLSVAKFKGKVVLVDFWATWCGPCVRELPNVLAAYAKYHDKGFEIVGIDFDDDANAFKTFIAEHKMTWPQYFDGKGWQNELGKKYGVNSIPATYLIDRDGKIVAKNLRGAALEQQLSKLLQ